VVYPKQKKLTREKRGEEGLKNNKRKRGKTGTIKNKALGEITGGRSGIEHNQCLGEKKSDWLSIAKFPSRRNGKKRGPIETGRSEKNGCLSKPKHPNWDSMPRVRGEGHGDPCRLVRGRNGTIVSGGLGNKVASIPWGKNKRRGDYLPPPKNFPN